MDAFWPTFTKRQPLPPDFTEGTTHKPSVRMSTPEAVILPLQDVPEDPFEVFVKTEEKVIIGQKIGIIGKAPEHIAVHATISGEVAAITSMPHPLVHEVCSIKISSDGSETEADPKPFIEGGTQDVFEFFREMGIPLDYKSFKDTSMFFVNTTEFESTFSSKARILLEEPEKLAEGLKVLMKSCGIKEALIVSEKRQAFLNPVLNNVCGLIPGVMIQTVDRPYPDTIQELVRQKAILGYKDDKKKLAIDTIMVLDPGILVAVYDAYFLGIPFMEQMVTVTGSGIPIPQNMWVKCGTQISDIIQQASGSVSCTKRVTLGGPLMGRPQPRLEAPLIKKTRGIFAAVALVFDEERRSRFYKRSPCVRCGKCVDVCPAGIPPNIIADLVEHKRMNEAEEFGLFSCLECGLCYYVCPSMIPLVELLKLGKLNCKGRESLLIFNSYRTLSS